MALETLAPGTTQYPLVRASGPARERGRQYGRQVRQRIQNTLSGYADLFMAYAEIEWPEVRRYGLRYEPIIRAHNAELVEEMHGIAEGAGVDFEDVLAINVRTEVMYGLGELRAAADCTAFAATPEATANGHTLLGQNWDWHPAAFDCCVVLAMEQDDRPSFVSVVEAGLLAKMGMNDRGVGVVTNAMVSDKDKGEPGIPYHVLLRTILNTRDFAEANEAVMLSRRASSASFLIASKEGKAVDLEVAPGGSERVFSVEPSNGVVGHANCFIGETANVVDQTRIKKPLSFTRQIEIDRVLRERHGAITADVMKSELASHANKPNSLCRHPIESLPPIDRSATVASVVMDLDEGVSWIADGQPCCHPYRRFEAADLWGKGGGSQ